MVAYIGIGICLLLILLLASKEGETLANIILLVWLLVICCWERAFPFPCFMYLYTAAMTNQLPRNRKWILQHFIPALVAVLFFLPVLLRSAEGKLAFIRSEGEVYQVYEFVYVLWALWFLRRHKLYISQELSYEERINLNWLRYFIYGLAAIWLIIVVTKSDYWVFGAAPVREIPAPDFVSAPFCLVPL